MRKSPLVTSYMFGIMYRFLSNFIWMEEFEKYNLDLTIGKKLLTKLEINRFEYIGSALEINICNESFQINIFFLLFSFLFKSQILSYMD